MADVTPVDEEPTTLDQLAAEYEAPTEYPPGAPEFTPYLQLKPRSRRAAFKRKFAELETCKDKIANVRKTMAGKGKKAPTGADSMLASADIDDMIDLLDQLLAMAAVNPEAYQTWSEGLVDDNVLTETFNVYMSRTHPGEASSSAS